MECNLRDVRIVRTTAAYDCGGRCPLRLHVKDGIIVRVEGDDTEETESTAHNASDAAPSARKFTIPTG
jgi:anaerobic selenocysteine-containing dehydrogenase